MRRGDADDRPPIEIVGVEPSIESVARVSSGPRGPRSTRSRAAMVAAGIAAVLLVGLVVGDDGGTESAAQREERDNRLRTPELGGRTSTTPPRGTTTRPPTTTTTTLPPGPVFGQPVGGALLVYGGGSGTAVVVDADTGVRHPVGIPMEDPYAAVAVRGGVALVAGREARLYDTAEPQPSLSSVLLGIADQVLPAGRPDRLWLVDYEDNGTRVDEPPTPSARLVDLSGAVLRAFDVPTGVMSAGTTQGVVLARGGRTYLVDEGGVHPFGQGYPVRATADAVITLSCDAEAECAIVKQPVDGSRSTPLVEVGNPDRSGYDAFVADDGRIGLVGYHEGGGDSTVELFGRDGAHVGSVPASYIGGGLPQWLSGDLGLVVPTGQSVSWLHQVGDKWILDPLPAMEDLPADFVFVIPP